MGISDRIKLFQESKIRASILLKDLRSPVLAKNAEAAARFRKIARFSSLSPEEIIAAKDDVRRKHALAVIAAERGFSCWAALKAYCNPEHPDAKTQFDSSKFFSKPRGAFLNRWFVDYAQAKESLEKEGGYLLPYRDQYFICESGFIEALGLDPNDPDWERIGRNGIEPADQAAWARISASLKERL